MTEEQAYNILKSQAEAWAIAENKEYGDACIVSLFLMRDGGELDMKTAIQQIMSNTNP